MGGDTEEDVAAKDHCRIPFGGVGRLFIWIQQLSAPC